MTAEYDKLGVRFLYPENWQITDENQDSWPRTVSVQSPGGGFWSLSIHAPPSNTRELAEAVVETMREECEQFEVEPADEVLADLPTIGYDMAFYCLDLVVLSYLRVFKLGVRTIVLLYQAESREYDQIGPVFQAITTSLLREANASA